MISLGKKISGPEQFFFFHQRKKILDGFETERTHVSCLERPFSEKGEFAGVLPRKFLSFHCSDVKSNEMNENNNEGVVNSPNVPQIDETKTLIVERMKTSPAKSLAVLNVASGAEPTSKYERKTVATSVRIASY